jgi:hypothetical protein
VPSEKSSSTGKSVDRGALEWKCKCGKFSSLFFSLSQPLSSSNLREGEIIRFSNPPFLLSLYFTVHFVGVTFFVCLYVCMSTRLVCTDTFGLTCAHMVLHVVSRVLLHVVLLHDVLVHVGGPRTRASAPRAWASAKA